MAQKHCAADTVDRQPHERRNKETRAEVEHRLVAVEPRIQTYDQEERRQRPGDDREQANEHLLAAVRRIPPRDYKVHAHLTTASTNSNGTTRERRAIIDSLPFQDNPPRRTEGGTPASYQTPREQRSFIHANAPANSFAHPRRPPVRAHRLGFAHPYYARRSLAASRLARALHPFAICVIHTRAARPRYASVRTSGPAREYTSPNPIPPPPHALLPSSGTYVLNSLNISSLSIGFTAYPSIPAS